MKWILITLIVGSPYSVVSTPYPTEKACMSAQAVFLENVREADPGNLRRRFMAFCIRGSLYYQ